ncbi:calcium-binding protein [Rhizobium sp. SG_E_25_P2]|uniref:calcium-binding protein n=1 Tax=Rhizobium sp. SG_E_25_P2 TaxID=2879942 RepID=UPI00247390C7|nr:calcium-binding protein [Rhizobium sp. SG_E_25_P2]
MIATELTRRFNREFVAVSPNTLTGNKAANILNGGKGDDALIGGGGADVFVFDSKLNAASDVDHLLDFNVKDDVIRLKSAVFDALSTGVLEEVMKPSVSRRHRPYTPASGQSRSPARSE